MSKLTPLELKLAEALDAAISHLDYCGYGDSWERDCAKQSKLSEKLEAAMKEAEEAGYVQTHT